MDHIRLSEAGDSVVILDQSLLPLEEKYFVKEKEEGRRKEKRADSALCQKLKESYNFQG